MTRNQVEAYYRDNMLDGEVAADLAWLQTMVHNNLPNAKAAKQLHRIDGYLQAMLPRSNEITITLTSASLEKVNKLKENLSALGKGEFDLAAVVEQLLKEHIEQSLNKYKHPDELIENICPRHFNNPKVGDWWNEMGNGYLSVVEVKDPNDFVVVTHMRLRGIEPGVYRINRQWLGHFVGYKSDIGLQETVTHRDMCAWVVPRSGNHENVIKLVSWYHTEGFESEHDLRSTNP